MAHDNDNSKDSIVTVIVVNFNSGGFLKATAESVLKSTATLELIVVDNCSTDQSLLQLADSFYADPRLKIIRNRLNAGFAKANNIAIAKARGDYILILNPDCIIEPDTIRHLAIEMQTREDVGAAGVLIHNPDGTEQAGCRRTIPTPWRTLVRVFHLDRYLSRYSRFRSFEMKNSPLPEVPVEVEAISGAFMFVKRRAIDAIGLLDDKYFMHCEDLDWCMRFRRAGWKILFIPHIKILHYKGVCSNQNPFKVMWYKHFGMMRFYRKFFKHQYPAPIMILVFIGIWLRFISIVTYNIFSNKFGLSKKTLHTTQIQPSFEITQSSRALSSEVAIDKHQPNPSCPEIRPMHSASPLTENQTKL